MGDYHPNVNKKERLQFFLGWRGSANVLQSCCYRHGDYGGRHKSCADIVCEDAIASNTLRIQGLAMCVVSISYIDL